MTIRVGVLDDHRAFSEAIAVALGAFDGITTIGVANTIEALVVLARAHDPDVLLIDFQLTEGTGIDCAQRLEREGLDCRLLLLTAHASADVTTRALRGGFERVLSKEAPLEEIVQAVRTPGQGADRTAVTKDAVRLSRRQREVLELMGQGLDPASIAAELFISVHTARSHVKDVLRALGSSTQLSAVTKAIREGYLPPPTKHDVQRV